MTEEEKKTINAVCQNIDFVILLNMFLKQHSGIINTTIGIFLIIALCVGTVLISIKVEPLKSVIDDEVGNRVQERLVKLPSYKDIENINCRIDMIQKIQTETNIELKTSVKDMNQKLDKLIFWQLEAKGK